MATKVWTEDMIDSVRQQIPLRKTATPEDVANLVAFLVSPEADYITGQAISPNGGIHAGAI
jgi:NAD(P)-dependent dehydrogenase (short-subunit alcohol dehydrogenase family)